MKRLLFGIWAMGLLAITLRAAEPVGVVTNVRVTSDKVTDVSSLEAWKKNTITDGMTEQEKAIAVFRTVVGFEHEVDAPQEFIQHGGAVADAIKTFNVYGYNLCGPGASHVVELARYLGMKARGWNINGHSVAEIFYDDAWHMFDASYISYFPKEDGVVASVDEIMADVKAWHEHNPGYKGQDAKLSSFRREDGFTAWKKKGPPLLARCPFYSERGVLPAGGMDWHQTMRQYDGSVSFEYETGYSMGYRANLQLRPGEKILWNWSHDGLHVNVLWEGKDTPWMKLKPGEGPMKYTRDFGDLAPGRVGNGGYEWNVPLGDAGLERSAWRYENLRARSKEEGGGIIVKDAAKAGVLELRVTLPYVLLAGGAAVKTIQPEGASVTVSISDNNGREWMDRPGELGAEELLDLSRMTHRHYTYLLRFTMKGKGAGLAALKIIHSFQHSQRALPIVVSGENRISFSAGGESTITVEPSLFSKSKMLGQLTYEDFGAKLEGMAEREGGGIGVEKEAGTLTLPIETPEEIKRVRIFSYYRARDAKEGFAVEVSFDGGKTWEKAGECAGGRNFGSALLTVDKIPVGTKKALVRWSGRQSNASMLFNLRIDADYVPKAAGFRPVRVTYKWTEDGVEKSDVHVAKKSAEDYAILCGLRTIAKSVMIELAE